MTGVLAADAAGEVDEAPAVDVGHARALGPLDDELGRGHSPRDEAAAVHGNPLRGGLLGHGHRVIFRPAGRQVNGRSGERLPRNFATVYNLPVDRPRIRARRLASESKQRC